MGDPNSRKKQALNRLRAQLRKKKESLADQFDFKMYIAFVFKEKKKKAALFEASEVIPVMTNNYEESILKGVRDSSYSLESSTELLQRDVVQLHAPRYRSMRRDVIGCTQEMDFILWPRNDIEKIVCLLFSRWKESDEPFRPVQAKFEFHHGDYEKQFLHVLSRKDKTGIVVNNPNQSVFLFIDRQHLQLAGHFPRRRGDERHLHVDESGGEHRVVSEEPAQPARQGPEGQTESPRRGDAESDAARLPLTEVGPHSSFLETKERIRGPAGVSVSVPSSGRPPTLPWGLSALVHQRAASPRGDCIGRASCSLQE